MSESAIDSAQEVLSGINDTVHLLMSAQHGDLDDGEMRVNLRGDDASEALGHSYHIRDALRENGYQAEAEYIGLADEQPDWSSQDRHVIHLKWSKGRDLS